MDPVTLAILAGVAGTAASNLGTLMPSELAKTNKRRLEELQRRESQGALGLTQKEEAAIRGGLRTGADRAREQAEAQRKALLAGSGMATGGQALQQAVIGEEQQQRAETAIAGQVLAQDLAEAQREEEEMRALEAAVEQRRRELADAFGAVAGAGLEAGATTSAQQAIIQGPRDISDVQAKSLGAQLGVSPKEARGFYELALENPEMLQYLIALQGS
jgi:hypothetical protein